MIDLSDGLSSDLGHICRESGTGAKIFAEKIPIDRKLVEFSKSPEEQLGLALNGGEDFELLFTINPENISHKNLTNAHRIGEITENVGNIEFIRDGKSEVLAPKGFQHF